MTMKKKTTKAKKKVTITQEAQRLLSKVPSTKWIAHLYSDEEGACCMLGHFQRLKSKNPKDYSYVNCFDHNESPARQLREATKKYLKDVHDLGNFIDGTAVNNTNKVNGYTEPKIKDRVMHLLNDMVKAGY